MAMAGHERGSNGGDSRALRTVQGFKVFKDTSLPSLHVDSPGEMLRYLEDDFGLAIPPSRPSTSKRRSFICDSPTIPGLDGAHDVPRDSETSPGKEYNRKPTDLGSVISPGTNVLTKNTLKINLSPRVISAKHVQDSIQDKPSSRSKRRLLQEDCDAHQYPRKSPKLKYSTSRLGKELIVQAEDERETPLHHEIHKEPLDSTTLVVAPNPQEAARNDALHEASPPTNIAAPEHNSIATESTEQSLEESFTTFDGGNVTTPRPSAMYNFNSALRMLNPFKAVGNLFGRLSATHSPSKAPKETLGSEEIAKQVHDHLKHFEDNLFDRLVAFQAGKSGHTSADLSSPQYPGEQHDESLRLAAESSLSPSYKLEHELLSVANSSPPLPVSQFKNVALHDPSLQRLDESDKRNFRRSLAAVLQSPTEERSRRNMHSKQTADDVAEMEAHGNNRSDLDVLMQDVGVSAEKNGFAQNRQIDESVLEPPPRLRNKASQHLKKMASKMNLRSRKSKVGDGVPANNDDYRVMKRKNKDEILKDYLALQGEKRELEKQLAMKSTQIQPEESANIVVPDATSPDIKDHKKSEIGIVPPVLLQATTPNPRVKQKRSNSSDSEEVEQTRTKRRALDHSRPDKSSSSPLASTSKGVPDMRLSHSEEFQVTKIHEDSGEKDHSKMDGEIDGEQASRAVKTVPPVPAVPSKYRSRVPKPTQPKDHHKSKKPESEWKGWDPEVF